MYIPVCMHVTISEIINSCITFYSIEFYKNSQASHVNSLMAILHETPYVSACIIDHIPAVCICIHSLALHMWIPTQVAGTYSFPMTLECNDAPKVRVSHKQSAASDLDKNEHVSYTMHIWPNLLTAIQQTLATYWVLVLNKILQTLKQQCAELSLYGENHVSRTKDIWTQYLS